MSNAYPSGVDSVSGEESYECANCGERIDPLDFFGEHKCECENCEATWNQEHVCLLGGVTANEFCRRVEEINDEVVRETGRSDFSAAYAEAVQEYRYRSHKQHTLSQ